MRKYLKYKIAEIRIGWSETSGLGGGIVMELHYCTENDGVLGCYQHLSGS